MTRVTAYECYVLICQLTSYKHWASRLLSVYFGYGKEEYISLSFVTEMLTALNNFDIDKITEIINQIYNRGDLLANLSRYIFIALLRSQVKMNVSSNGQSV